MKDASNWIKLLLSLFLLCCVVLAFLGVAWQPSHIYKSGIVRLLYGALVDNIRSHAGGKILQDNVFWVEHFKRAQKKHNLCQFQDLLDAQDVTASWWNHAMPRSPPTLSPLAPACEPGPSNIFTCLTHNQSVSLLLSHHLPITHHQTSSFCLTEVSPIL